MINSSECDCRRGEETLDHVLWHCKIHKKERESMIEALTKREKIPLTRNAIDLFKCKDRAKTMILKKFLISIKKLI